MPDVPAIFDVTDVAYGAVGDGATDCTSAFQACFDAAIAAAGTTHGAEIYVPAKTNFFLLNTPVWLDGDNVRLRGDGIGSHIQCNNGPAIIVGIRRAPLGTNLPATAIIRVDSGAAPPDNILDASVAGAHYGNRTTTLEGVSFSASPAQLDQVSARLMPAPAITNWAVFTLDFCVKNNSSWGQADSYALCGCFHLSQGSWVPSPYYVYVDTTPRIHLQFMTSDGVVRDFVLASTLADDTAAHRVTIEVNGTAGAVTAYLDGATIAVTGTLPAGSVLAEPRDFALFKLGSVGKIAATFNEYYGTVCDLTWAAFRIGRTVRFQDNAGAQQRVDLGVLNDNYQFFDTTAASLVFYLPEIISPGGGPAYDRRVWWNGPVGSANGFGLFLSSQNTDPNAACANLSIENLRINGSSASECIALGEVLNFHVNGCFLYGGYRGIGSVPVMVSYPVIVRNTAFLLNRDAPIHAYGWIGHVLDCNVDQYGHCAIRAIGSSLRITKTFFSAGVTGNASILRFPAYGNNGINTLEDSFVDYEGGSPTDDYIYLEAEPSVPGSQLAIRNCFLGTLGTGLPLIRARSHANNYVDGWRAGTILIDGLQVGTVADNSLDNFSGVNGTALTAHAPDVARPGQGWANLQGTFKLLNAGGIVGLIPDSDNHGDMAVLNTAFYDGRWVVTVTPYYKDTGNAERAGLLFRATNATNWWFLDWTPDLGYFSLIKCQAGRQTVVKILTLPATGPLVPAVLQVDCEGPEITTYLNGQKQFTVLDSFNRYATLHGVRLLKTGTPGGLALWNCFHGQRPLVQTQDQVIDTFTDTNGTALTAHTPNTGGAWTTVTGTFKILGNCCVPNSDADNDMALINTGWSDGLVAADTTAYYTGAGNVDNPQLVFRATDVNNYWYLRWQPETGGTLVIFKMVAGVLTFVDLLANVAVVPSGQATQVMATFNGPNIAYFINGRQILRCVDTFNQTATRCGIFLAKGGAPPGLALWNNFRAIQVSNQWSKEVQRLSIT